MIRSFFVVKKNEMEQLKDYFKRIIVF